VPVEGAVMCIRERYIQTHIYIFLIFIYIYKSYIYTYVMYVYIYTIIYTSAHNVAFVINPLVLLLHLLN
jgi:hypothetical protein